MDLKFWGHGLFGTSWLKRRRFCCCSTSRQCVFLTQFRSLNVLLLELRAASTAASISICAGGHT